MNLSIRQVQPGQFEAVAAIAREATDSCDPSAHCTGATPWSSIGRSRSHHRSDLCLVAVLDGRSVGYASAQWKTGHRISKARATIAVLDSARRCGIGRALISQLAAETSAVGITSLEFHTRSGGPGRVFATAVGAVPTRSSLRFERDPSESQRLIPAIDARDYLEGLGAHVIALRDDYPDDKLLALVQAKQAMRDRPMRGRPVEGDYLSPDYLSAEARYRVSCGSMWTLTLALLTDGQPIAFAEVMDRSNGTGPMNLLEVATVVGQRRRGVGTAIAALALQTSVGPRLPTDATVISVADSANAPSQRLHQNLGFRRTATYQRWALNTNRLS